MKELKIILRENKIYFLIESAVYRTREMLQQRSSIQEWFSFLESLLNEEEDERIAIYSYLDEHHWHDRAEGLVQIFNELQLSDASSFKDVAETLEPVLPFWGNREAFENLSFLRALEEETKERLGENFSEILGEIKKREVPFVVFSEFADSLDYQTLDEALAQYEARSYGRFAEGAFASMLEGYGMLSLPDEIFEDFEDSEEFDEDFQVDRERMIEEYFEQVEEELDDYGNFLRIEDPSEEIEEPFYFWFNTEAM